MNERGLGILKLFSLEKPAWSVEDIAAEMGTSVSTAYRFIAQLEAGGLVTAARPRIYVLGPSIIQYYRQIQLTDPLVIAARPVMNDLVRFAPPGSVMLLCRWFGETVLCVHQIQSPGLAATVSYVRGRPMPLFRGATSKIILANLPARLQKKLYELHASEIAESGFGSSWEEFKSNLMGLRKVGVSVTHADVDAGVVGIASAIVGGDGRVLGSLSFVIRDDLADALLLTRLTGLLPAAVREVEMAVEEINTKNTTPS